MPAMKSWQGVRLTLGLMVLVSSLMAVASVSGHSRFKSVALGDGAIGSYRWGALAHRDHGREGGKRPCIQTIVLWREAWGVLEDDTTLCGALPRGGPPIILSSSHGEGERQVTVFALAFEPRIVSVTLDLGADEPMHLHLHRLNEKQARISGLRPFRYQSFDLKGPFCLHEVIGFNALGQEIYRGPQEECPASGS